MIDTESGQDATKTEHALVDAEAQRKEFHSIHVESKPDSTKTEQKKRFMKEPRQKSLIPYSRE